MRFLVVDAAALVLWASAYAGLGRVFAPQVEALIRASSTYATWILIVGGCALVLAGGVFRVRKSRAHATGHAPMAPSGVDRPELMS